MKENEDGYYSVADCVEALTRTPNVSLGLSKYSRYVDMRTNNAKTLQKVMRQYPVGKLHWAMFRSSATKSMVRHSASHAVHLTLDGCEDFDQLITVLQTLNKMNQ